jgi:hypothetical protein
MFTGDPLGHDSPLTGAQRAFLDRFDRGDFPDLEDRETVEGDIGNAAQLVLLTLEHGAEHGIKREQFLLLQAAYRRIRMAQARLRR